MFQRGEGGVSKYKKAQCCNTAGMAHYISKDEDKKFSSKPTGLYTI
jgi:hypothetical protein